MHVPPTRPKHALKPQRFKPQHLKPQHSSVAHRLESNGPSWRSPGLTDVMRRLPFLTNEAESMLLWLRAYGELRAFNPGQCIVPRRVRRH